MRISKLLIPTLREMPADAEIVKINETMSIFISFGINI